MKDRIPRYPGRIRLTPVPGQSNVYDLERADNPTEPGTPLSKLTLLSDEAADMVLEAHPGSKVDTVSQAIGLLSKPALVREFTLYADLWDDDGMQVASVPSVVPDEIKQAILIIPTLESQDEFDETLIRGVKQGHDTITFTYRGPVPEKDVRAYAVIYNTYLEEDKA